MTGTGRISRIAGELPASDLAPDFNRLASLYRWMEWASFGPFLGLCRRTFLIRLRDCRRALFLGDGDGRFSARLLSAYPHIRVDAVDASPSMVRALVRRAGEHGDRLTTCVADIRAWSPQGDRTYDAVVSHFFLDCLTTAEIRDLARRIYPVLTPNALWVVSEFAVPPTPYGRWFARPLVALLYWAFGGLTGLRVRRLPDHAAAMQQAGFRLLERRSHLLGLLISELWAVDS